MILHKIQEKIKKKETEVQQLEEQSRELEAQLREAHAYIQALEDLKKSLPTEGAGEVAIEKVIRPGTDLDKVREILKNAGKPMHISQLLQALGKPLSKNSRASLTGSIGAHVRKNQIFTRPAPNTFGLINWGIEEDNNDDEVPDFQAAEEALKKAVSPLF